VRLGDQVIGAPMISCASVAGRERRGFGKIRRTRFATSRVVAAGLAAHRKLAFSFFGIDIATPTGVADEAVDSRSVADGSRADDTWKV